MRGIAQLIEDGVHPTLVGNAILYFSLSTIIWKQHVKDLPSHKS